MLKLLVLGKKKKKKVLWGEVRERGGQSLEGADGCSGGGSEGKKRVKSGSRGWFLWGGDKGEKRAKLIRAK